MCLVVPEWVILVAGAFGLSFLMVSPLLLVALVEGVAELFSRLKAGKDRKEA